MAAQRYEKTGSKALARRCLARTAELYANLPTTDADKPVELEPAKHASWSIIVQHIEHSLGRQAYSLGHAEEAIHYFFKLLQASAAAPNEESLVDDQDVWDDLMNAHEVFLTGRSIGTLTCA
jgi:hypothetical protein